MQGWGRARPSASSPRTSTSSPSTTSARRRSSSSGWPPRSRTTGSSPRRGRPRPAIPAARARLVRRSARRHDQLRARAAAVLGVDRPLAIESRGRCWASSRRRRSAGRSRARRRAAARRFNGKANRAVAAPTGSRARCSSPGSRTRATRCRPTCPSGRRSPRRRRGRGGSARRRSISASSPCGWLDGYWERALHPWDLVAGAAIVIGAGGQATELDGTPFDGETGRVLASNGPLHEQMIEVLRGRRPADRQPPGR